MHSLIDQFAAARPFGVGTPFALIAETATVPIAPTEEHQRPQCAEIDCRTCREHRRMVAVVETDSYESAMRARGGYESIDLFQVAGRRFLDEDVLARLNCGNRHRCQGVIGRRDDNDVNIGSTDGFLPIFDCPSVAPAGQLLRSFGHRVGADSETGALECSSALGSNQAAADDRDARHGTHRLPHVKPRSAGTMRRRV